MVIADALYMLAYDEAVEFPPALLRGGCNIVGRSEHVVHLWSNAAVGAVGYAAMAVLALWTGNKPPTPSMAALPSGHISGGLIASVFLTWEQAKVKAWCFWCPFSGGQCPYLPAALWQGARDRRSVAGVDRRIFLPECCTTKFFIAGVMSAE